MTISSPDDEVDHSSWYTFWEAATAINAMCVGTGKAGIWAGIGEYLENDESWPALGF